MRGGNVNIGCVTTQVTAVVKWGKFLLMTLENSIEHQQLRAISLNIHSFGLPDYPAYRQSTSLNQRQPQTLSYRVSKQETISIYWNEEDKSGAPTWSFVYLIINYQKLLLTLHLQKLGQPHFTKEYIVMFGEVLVWKQDGEWLEAERHDHQEEDLSNS